MNYRRVRPERLHRAVRHGADHFLERDAAVPELAQHVVGMAIVLLLADSWIASKEAPSLISITSLSLGVHSSEMRSRPL
jgi:hypothetical protein